MIPASRLPICRQLSQSDSRGDRAGKLQPQERLPSVREFTARWWSIPTRSPASIRIWSGRGSSIRGRGWVSSWPRMGNDLSRKARRSGSARRPTFFLPRPSTWVKAEEVHGAWCWSQLGQFQWGDAECRRIVQLCFSITQRLSVMLQRTTQSLAGNGVMLKHNLRLRETGRR